MTRGRAQFRGAVLVVALAACTGQRTDGDAIVVAIANSPAVLDPRVGTDDAPQKAPRPDLDGVRLSPVVDFTLLRSVSRRAAAP